MARSRFLYGLCNGFIGEHTTVVESTSGNTAVSEAYFARLLGLRFMAVMPALTSPEKIRVNKFYGGDCHLVNNAQEVDTVAERLARENNGHFMDQFTYAERVTD